MRPKKGRKIKCFPGNRFFKPRCKSLGELEVVYLELNEFEALMADLEQLEQIEAAKEMGISRPTFSRIIASAHKKIAEALVHIKAIEIEKCC